MASVQDRWYVESVGSDGKKVRTPTPRSGVGKRWRTYYRTPDGRQRSKSFDKKIDAERYLTTVESSKLVGSYVDPALARITVGDWSTRWLLGQAHLKPSTTERYSGIVRVDIDPRWKKVKLADVSHADVQSWVSDLARTRAPATVRKIHRVFSLILAHAVNDGRLARNPAAGVNLPRVVQAERKYLSHAQVLQLADACAKPVDASKHRRLDELENPTARLVVLFLAYTGVRWGELAALRVRRLDFSRRRALIADSVTLVGSSMVWGTPKGHQRREVPLPRFLAAELAEYVKDRDPDDLVFVGVRGGGVLRGKVFRRGGFDNAAKSIGLPGLRPHELRHTAASLAIASGADVKVIQQMLGHASASMTLDQYGHLFSDRLDEVADAMDAARQLLLPERCPGAIDAATVALAT